MPPVSEYLPPPRNIWPPLEPAHEWAFFSQKRWNPVIFDVFFCKMWYVLGRVPIGISKNPFCWRIFFQMSVGKSAGNTEIRIFWNQTFSRWSLYSEKHSPKWHIPSYWLKYFSLKWRVLLMVACWKIRRPVEVFNSSVLTPVSKYSHKNKKRVQLRQRTTCHLSRSNCRKSSAALMFFYYLSLGFY